MSARDRQLPAGRVLSADRVEDEGAASVANQSLAQALARRYDAIRPEKIVADSGVTARKASYLTRRI